MPDAGGPWNELEHWRRIVALVREYAARKYGRDADALTIHFARRRDGEPPHYEAFPPWAAEAYAPPAAVGRVAAPPWVNDPARPDHMEDWRLVYEPGLGVFRLTEKQAAVAAKLWEAREAGLPHVRQADLLRAADSDCDRLQDLFRRSPAWGVLILPGAIPGSFTLPNPDGGPAA